jgi:hypothetical protein
MAVSLRVDQWWWASVLPEIATRPRGEPNLPPGVNVDTSIDDWRRSESTAEQAFVPFRTSGAEVISSGKA